MRGKPTIALTKFLQKIYKNYNNFVFRCQITHSFLFCSLFIQAFNYIFYTSCIIEEESMLKVISLPFFSETLPLPGFLMVVSGHSSLQSSRRSALKFTIFNFSFLYTSQIQTIPRSSEIIYNRFCPLPHSAQI